MQLRLRFIADFVLCWILRRVLTLHGFRRLAGGVVGMALQSIGDNSFFVLRKGAGEAVVLLHGVGADHEAWDGVVSELDQRFDIIRYDLRGHGRSDKPSGPYALDDFVQDLRGILRANEIEKAHIVGFSLGGLVAQAFALQYPECVNKLVLISTVAGRTSTERDRVIARAETLSKNGANAHLSEAVTRWFTDDFIAARPDVLEWRRRKSLENDPMGYAASYRVLAESDLADQLHRVGAHTLVMTGECDVGSTPRMAQLIAERIPQAVCVIFPQLKHSILLEAPDKVSNEIRRFLSVAIV